MKYAYRSTYYVIVVKTCFVPQKPYGIGGVAYLAERIRAITTWSLDDPYIAFSATARSLRSAQSLVKGSGRSLADPYIAF